ncbi:MAG: FecR domain-containing protein [Bacteroidales bacterium]|nr:FecR domain-containing protein [Bacteroidales bacterium]
MEEKPQNIDTELCAKYLARETNDEQRLAFEAWLAASENNEREFAAYKLIWEKSSKSEVFNEDIAWKRLENSLFKNTKHNKQVGSKVFSIKHLSIAASVAILVVSYLFYFMKDNEKQIDLTQVISTAEKQQKQQKLEDGSLVCLNQNSEFHFANSYSDLKQRLVKLSGEAFFEVAPDAEKPFVIETPNGKIRVVGTSFNVMSNDSLLVVSVKSGKVAVLSNASDVETILSKDEGVTVSVLNNEISKYRLDDLNSFAWQTKYLLFNDVSLKEAVMEINKCYYSNIIIADSTIQNFHVFAEFENKSLNTILTVLENTFNISVEKQSNGQILLDSKTD